MIVNITRPKCPMTDYEILKSYREAANPRKQIEILARRNNISEEWIRTILKENGVDGRSLPRKKRISTPPAAPADPPAFEPTPELSDVAEPIAPREPVSLKKCGTVIIETIGELTDIVERLTKQKEELTNTITEAQEKISEIDRVLVEVGRASSALAKS